MEIATFAAGCFWGVEYEFEQLCGVISARVGYTGGYTVAPTYEQVCEGETGHAEAVEIEFDPEIMPYEELLEIFFKIHDPTSLNKQGFDVGSQYRSAIFYHTDEQKRQAEEYKVKHQQEFAHPIVTEIVQACEFYPAEEYHQKYFQKTGRTSCR